MPSMESVLLFTATTVADLFALQIGFVKTAIQKPQACQAASTNGAWKSTPKYQDTEVHCVSIYLPLPSSRNRI